MRSISTEFVSWCLQGTANGRQIPIYPSVFLAAAPVPCVMQNKIKAVNHINEI